MIEKVDVYLSSKKIGSLAYEKANKIYFQYDDHFINTGFNISPFALNFNKNVQLSKNMSLNDGLHGVFNDSLPDGWGMLLMDRYFKNKLNIDRHQIRPLDRLTFIGDRAMGALEYRPSINYELSNEINLALLAKNIEALRDGKTEEIITSLMIQGGSPGGARPKVTVALSEDKKTCLSGFSTIPENFNHWIVKFPAKLEKNNVGILEKFYYDVAVNSGIEMMESSLISIKENNSSELFFATKRFDRSVNIKHHVISLAGLLEANFRLPCMDYLEILKTVGHLTKNKNEIRKAFNLMLFNIIMHNKDDHIKNFSFIYQENKWQLSPAFDLTFSSGMNNEHTSSINGSGNPNFNDIQKIADEMQIDSWMVMFDKIVDSFFGLKYQYKKDFPHALTDVFLASIDENIKRIKKNNQNKFQN